MSETWLEKRRQEQAPSAQPVMEEPVPTPAPTLAEFEPVSEDEIVSVEVVDGQESSESTIE